jgi:hypothetical protein
MPLLKVSKHEHDPEFDLEPGLGHVGGFGLQQRMILGLYCYVICVRGKAALIVDKATGSHHGHDKVPEPCHWLLPSAKVSDSWTTDSQPA